MKRVFAYEIQMISYYISEFMNLKKKPSAIIKINIHPKFKRYLIEKLNINDKRYKEVPDLIKNFYLKKYFRSQMTDFVNYHTLDMTFFMFMYIYKLL
jgi:hypothetical protein